MFSAMGQADVVTIVLMILRELIAGPFARPPDLVPGAI